MLLRLVQSYEINITFVNETKEITMDREMSLAIESILSGRKEKIEKELHEPRFTAGDTEVKHRNITHWDKNGLLDQVNTDGKWRRYSYYDLIWLRIIAHLRSFEIPFRIIKEIKSSLYDPTIGMDELYDDPGVKKVINDLAQKIEGKTAENISNPEELNSMAQTKMSALEFMVYDAILLHSQYLILCNKEGMVLPVKQSALEKYAQLFESQSIIQGSFLAISLTEVIGETFKKIDVDVLSEQLAFITPKEAAILKLLKAGGLKSLRVTFNSNEEIDLIEETRVKKVDPVSRFTEVLLSDGYNTMTAKTQNGNITHFEISTRYKIEQVLSAGRPSENR